MFVIDASERRLSNSGKTINLPAKPFYLLLYFVSNRNTLLTTDKILAEVWPNSIVTPGSVKDYVALIRRALNDSARNPSHIETVRGLGYRYIGDIQIENNKSNSEITPFCSIPADLTPFVGRKAELKYLSGVIQNDDCRVLSIEGPGGIGKTRLGYALLRSLESLESRSSVYSVLAAVPLVSVQPQVEHILKAIAIALEITLNPHQLMVEQIKIYLAEKRAVLLLDNTEHLSDQLDVCIDLLRSLPLLTLIVTSRKPNSLYGEWRYSVHGLSLLEDEFHDSPDAIELFVACASRANPGINFSESDLSVVAELCQRLNGIPLAIEICAAWVQQMSVVEILESLQSNPSVMEDIKPIAGYGDISIALLMNQHWMALSEEQRTAFSALSVFRDEFSLEAAMFVSETSRSTLMELENRSMLLRSTDGRFSLHPVMREYGRDWLREHDTNECVVPRFLDYYISLAEVSNQNIFSGEQFTIIRTLELEHQNFRAALRICKENQNPSVNGQEKGLRLAGGLGMFWFLANHWAEGAEWARYFISQSEEDNPYIAGALLTKGGLAALNDNLELADDCLEQGIAAVKVHGPQYLYGRMLSLFGLVRRLQGRYDEAIALCDQSLVVFRELEDDGSSLVSLGCIGQSYIDTGEFALAVETFSQSVGLSQLVGNTFNYPHAVVNLARSYLALGERDVAAKYLNEIIPMLQKMGFSIYIAQALNVKGWLNILENKLSEAQVCFSQAGEHYRTLGDRSGLAESLEGISATACNNGDYLMAQKYLSAAKLQRQESNTEIPLSNQPIMQGVEIKLKDELSVKQIAQLRRIGQSVTPALLFTEPGSKH